jgi:hypothetical protein
MSGQSNSQYSAREQKVLAGVDKYFSNIGSLMLGGTAMSPADVKKVLADDLLAQAAAVAQHGQYLVMVQAARLTRAKVRALLKLLRTFIILQFGSNVAAVLEEFGFPVAATHPAKRTVKAKAQQVQKSLATRAARGTKGKKQKKEVVGTVAPQPGTPAPATPPSASK